MTSSELNQPTKYLVVGAGPCGLIAARAFLRAGLEVELVERHSDIGGIWDIENPGSPMYETCHFITSKHLGGFADYSMPEDYPTYPHSSLVLKYIKGMAEDYGLLERTRFGLNVVSAKPTVIAGVDAWVVMTSDGETREYRGVVYAGGQQWLPFKPEVEGEKDFEGEVITGNEYRYTDQLAGKKVLVVGAGNSGVDIAVDAAEHSEKALLSTRRAYHFLPKQVFGVPTPDLLSGKAELPDIPGISKDLSIEELVELVLSTVGNLGNYGLPIPKDLLGSTQPIVSDLVLHCFTHGTLTHRPNISRFHKNSVEFEDGSIEEVDLVIFATGYDIEIPWLPSDLLEYEAGHPHFHLGSLVPNVPGLYGIGVFHPSRADAWSVFDQLVQLCVADAVATLTGIGSEKIKMLRHDYNPDLKGDFPYLDVRRNVNQVETFRFNAMIDELESEFGIEMPRASKPGFYDSVLKSNCSA